MLSGDELTDALSVLPHYDKNICTRSVAERLIALSDLYDIYIPSPMSTEIYSKLYLALIRSLQKKQTHAATQQLNRNHIAMIQNKSQNGIIGGSDSFTIIGCSGLGKSCAIHRAISLITENKVIETENPYSKIIPCLVVQCPFDSSVKGLLLEILRKTDDVLGSDYYAKAMKIRVTTDMLIGTVSQISLNHIGLLIVDEIQNVVNSKNGQSLVGMLTQLINNSGISICMVGTPESNIFFEQAMQLARRSLGLQYTSLEYDSYFCDFCCTLYSYQYVQHEAAISDNVIQWLYEHSGGIISVVVSLIHDAQEIAILNGKERLNIEALNEAYKTRLTMLHNYMSPSISKRSQTSSKKSLTPELVQSNITKTDDITIAEIVSESKENNLELLPLLQKYFTVEVIKV